jgi:mono/diheme cytochrome c family protein
MVIGAVRRGFSARDRPSKGETFLATKLRSWSIPASAKALKSPGPITSQTVAEGRAHWADHCATCHANDGSGNTEIGQGLYPKAPDMRSARTQQLSDGQLYWIVENGVRLTGMPAWGDGRPDDQESWNLVAFIRHLPALTADEEREMQRLNPRSPDEQNEGDAEDAFLRGGAGHGEEHGPHKH